MNPASVSWARGNDAISLNGSESSATRSGYARRETGTGWDHFVGVQRSQPPRNTSNSNAGGRFVKQNAIGKTSEQRAFEQLQRDESRQQQTSEQVRLDDSDDSGSDDDEEMPY